MYCKKLNNILTISVKNISTKVKPQIEVSSKLIENIENGLFKPRRHPGIFKPRTINLPTDLIKAAEKSLKDYPVRQLLNDSQSLINYLRSRHPPVENSEYLNKKFEIENSILSQHPNIEILSNEEKREIKSKIKDRVIKILKTKLYTWKPVDYNIHTSLQYLLGRFAPEYAVLTRIFQEINVRDAEFKPRSFFDFGSGTGTATWAVKQFWQNTIFEYFNVDSSADMNDLALILLKGGLGVNDPNLKGVFYRQFLPATNNSYDIVVCSYSLLELPSSQARLQTILNLWNKTENYLVLVEQGTNAGFKVINEARDFILQLEKESGFGHVFSPCSNDNACPRFLENKIPCNFQISYMTMPIGQNSELHREIYCYVVLRKGRRKNETDLWPRIVSPTLVRSKHAICRMCTSDGKLEEIIFTASKHGRKVYQCAKATRWGDLLPTSIQSNKKSD